MAKVRADFIKGHMGGNRILLLDGSQLPSNRYLPLALAALDDLGLSGHQAGILLPPQRGGTVRVRVVSICGRNFIPACGGLTQVLSRALVDTELAERFPTGRDGGTRNVTIEFDELDITTEIHEDENGFARVDTDFTPFALDMLSRGVERVDLGGIHAWRVGYFFVMSAEQVVKSHPEVNFELMDDRAREIITLLQYRFLGSTGLTSWDFTLFDQQPNNGGDCRAVFPHNVRIGFIEPSCGTGSIALALAISADGGTSRVGTYDGEWSTIRIETGGRTVLGGPDLTTVKTQYRDGDLVQAIFSNDRIEIIAQGTIDL